MAGARDEEQYRRQIAAGLDRAFERAPVEELDPATARLVIFSDHHRGAGDQADDFRRCEHAYTAALGWYLKQGYRLALLGDVEELWEETPERALDQYRAVLSLEARFRTEAGGLLRFWGNHDDLWRHPRKVHTRLAPVLRGELTVHEGLRLRIRRPGAPEATLFLVHGHQGTADSDRFGWLSRAFVRWAWRPLQRKTGYSATTPARGHDLRARHDSAMFAWAEARQPGVVLIAGHTHRPVFGESTPAPPPARPIETLERRLADAERAGDRDAAAALSSELEYARTARRRPDEAVRVTPPCYFNTGCCSFPDGDVTGLEIADGELRLVRWPADLRELRPEHDGDVTVGDRVLARIALDELLDLVTAPPAGRFAEIAEERVAPRER